MDDREEAHTHKPRRKMPAWLPGWLVVRRIARIILGVILVILGLLALFTPLTPGSWLALVGLEILGLRVLLRDRLCRWARARPESRLRRATCRVLRLNGIEALRRRWRRRREAATPPARRPGAASEPQSEHQHENGRGDSRERTPPCEAPPVGKRVRRRPPPSRKT